MPSMSPTALESHMLSKDFFHMLTVNNNVVDSTFGVLLFLQQTCYNIVQEY